MGVEFGSPRVVRLQAHKDRRLVAWYHPREGLELALQAAFATHRTMISHDEARKLRDFLNARYPLARPTRSTTTTRKE
jgi:hypothetical protein